MRVLVAMSGGVDSAVAAGLLAEAGHEVIGVTLQLYDQGTARRHKGACCAGADIFDARRAADVLGIAHYVIDAEARFAAAVVADFADGYAAGETPVPCIRCNQTVKFADLTALATDLGAERVATGHYVQRIDGKVGPELHRAADPARDQSWFLFATTAPQLARAAFPLGAIVSKRQVRAEAARLGLAIADKPDSQDLCFVPTGGYQTVVERLRPEALAAGEIVDRSGTVLGRHDGIARYTVGQRRGLGDVASASGGPMVVVGSDPARRWVVVGPRAGAGDRRIRLREANWLVPPPHAAMPLSCQVKLRARDEMRDARVWSTISGGAEVQLDRPALAAPGQACVFYEGQRVLGGGFVQRPDAVDVVDAARPGSVCAASPSRLAV